MQIDDTIILADRHFSELEEQELIFSAKPKERLTSEFSLIFNGCIFFTDNDRLYFQQKEQNKKIKLINPRLPDFRPQYIEQCVRRVSIYCQHLPTRSYL